MLPYADWNIPLRWIYQHDNDPKRTEKCTKSSLNEHNIYILHSFPILIRSRIFEKLCKTEYGM